MKTLIDVIRVSVLVAVATVAISCTTYHHVTDTQTGSEYYTSDLERNDEGGVLFTDGKDGSRVNLPASEVREVNSEEYRAHTPVE